MSVTIYFFPRSISLVQRNTDPSPRNGPDGVDCAPDGGVHSHSVVPHHAADRDGLLEVKQI